MDGRNTKGIVCIIFICLAADHRRYIFAFIAISLIEFGKFRPQRKNPLGLSNTDNFNPKEETDALLLTRLVGPIRIASTPRFRKPMLI